MNFHLLNNVGLWLLLQTMSAPFCASISGKIFLFIQSIAEKHTLYARILDYSGEDSPCQGIFFFFEKFLTRF